MYLCTLLVCVLFSVYVVKGINVYICAFLICVIGVGYFSRPSRHWFWVRTKENTSFHTIWNGRTYSFRFVAFYYCELTSPCLRTHNTLTSSSITWIFISWYIFITVSFIVFNFLFSFIVFFFFYYLFLFLYCI